MSVSSVIRQGLGSTPSDLVRLGLGSGAVPTGQSEIVTLGLLFGPSKIITLGLEPAGGGGSAPTAPTGLSASVTSDTTATLTWTDASSDETGFVVQVDSGGGYVNASGATNPTAAGVQTFSATGLTAATTYAWRVGAVNGSGTSYTVGSSFTTDNAGSGGGTVPVYAPAATLRAAARMVAGGAASNTSATSPAASLRAAARMVAGGATAVRNVTVSGATLRAAARFRRGNAYVPGPGSLRSTRMHLRIGIGV